MLTKCKKVCTMLRKYVESIRKNEKELRLKKQEFSSCKEREYLIVLLGSSELKPCDWEDAILTVAKVLDSTPGDRMAAVVGGMADAEVNLLHLVKILTVGLKNKCEWSYFRDNANILLTSIKIICTDT